MIIGHGDLASVLTDRPDVLFFASGVSNSSSVDSKEYDREINLFRSQNLRQHVVYFSSLCIYDSKTRYAQHKRYMEQMVKSLSSSYTIVRIGNIDWGKNPHTLINYLKAHPDAEVQEVYRHIVSKQEFLYWMAKIRPGYQEEMNVPGKMWWVPDLAKELWGIGSLGYVPIEYVGNIKNYNHE